jgi:hypothetical protein
LLRRKEPETIFSKVSTLLTATSHRIKTRPNNVKYKEESNMKIQLSQLKPGKLIFIGLLSLGLTSASVSWAQIVVTTLADSGPGSLRQAIIDADTNPGADVITFVPGLAGVILLQTPFPNLTGTGDTIDGTGAGIALDGSALAAGSIGLNVRRSNYTIRGLTIQNMPNDGIRVQTPNPPTTLLTVTGVVIDSNTIKRSGSRGIRVSGGIGPGKTVDATLINNTIEDSAVAGILVNGNLNQTGDPGFNKVTALIDNNAVKKSKAGQADVGFGGDGIDIVGGTGAGDGNSVEVTVSNNVVKQNRDDGIVAVGCNLNATGSNNSVKVKIINNDVFDNGVSNPDLVTNTGIVVTGGSTETSIIEGEESSTCKSNTVVFEISGNKVTNNRSRNISVSGGPGGGPGMGHDLQGIISGNSAKDSPEGDGISISGGNGTENQVHDIVVSGNQVTRNFNRGILIAGGTESTNAVLTGIQVLSNGVSSNGSQGILLSGGTESVNVVLTGIDILSNQVRSNGAQGILVTGGTLSENATISDVLIDGNASNSNGSRGIQATRGTSLSASPPVISLAGVTNNTGKDNVDDGILIASSIPGSGTTPVSGNRADGNHVDGIDLNSTGYVVSNNTASRNTVDGINLGGNTDGGGNVARNNGSCNTPLPASCQ